MRTLSSLLVGIGLLFVSATPALADSTLFEHWETQLVCPHGWQVSFEDDIATLEPVDPATYPGHPVVLLFQTEYTFPYLMGPEDATTAAFEHLNSNYYVVKRGTPQPLPLDGLPELDVLLVEGQVEFAEEGQEPWTQEVAVLRIARSEDDAGVFAMLLGNDGDAITWAAYVVGSALGGLAFGDELTEELIRDYRLPATLE